MAHRPYPNADRARRELARKTPTPEPTELRKQMATQANTALSMAHKALRPVRTYMEAMADRQMKAMGVAVAALGRDLAGAAARSDLRPSMRLPSPEELPEVLARVGQHGMRRAQPDIHSR